jgi:hypothetical protein
MAVPGSSTPAVRSEQLVFVGGLHRSGTTLLADLLGAHPEISSLSGTGVWHDEGQFLQDVYPTAVDCGGPGRFAFSPRAHLTEDDAGDVPSTRARLLAGWSRYWDVRKPFFVEKSPPNLLRFRYLQTIFPEARFIAIVRHPVAVAYATAPWARLPTRRLLEHWLHAHELFEHDRPHVRRLILVRYEDLVRDVPATMAHIDASLGLRHHDRAIDVRRDTNSRYLRRWRHSRVLPVHPRVVLHSARLGRRLRALGYGYSLFERPGPGE